ncbi:MAG: hypothetical protein AVDCRST_MAG27-3565 [uncultured Craurococcus sp.]|uniref:Uncharacterized protein n=1 Tax=uncultured Craurococcus sp. TaxID=1135998 RepID=A0A6J4JED7_9PROT|nr:MAG: hypothetical protein AVDCRST_MAG27-3565 [uncultured Craurococcus sp.]
MAGTWYQNYRRVIRAREGPRHAHPRRRRDCRRDCRRALIAGAVAHAGLASRGAATAALAAIAAKPAHPMRRANPSLRPGTVDRADGNCCAME